MSKEDPNPQPPQTSLSLSRQTRPPFAHYYEAFVWQALAPRPPAQIPCPQHQHTTTINPRAPHGFPPAGAIALKVSLVLLSPTTHPKSIRKNCWWSPGGCLSPQPKLSTGPEEGLGSSSASCLRLCCELTRRCLVTWGSYTAIPDPVNALAHGRPWLDKADHIKQP